MNKMISAKNAPAAVGPYSHAVLAGNTLYTSGQLGLDPVSGELAAGVEAQAKQALENGLVDEIAVYEDMEEAYLDEVGVTLLNE